MPIQIPSIILPVLHPLRTETEDINDILEHISIEFPTSFMQEKQVQVVATEVLLAAGMPGNLWCWIELSPYPTAYSSYWERPLPISAAYWAAINGGGGALAPMVPLIEVATGVNLRTHPFMLPWTINAAWARVVVQTPVSATPAATYWSVQVMVSGQVP